MLTTMVAGPGPTAYCENGGRYPHQVLDVVPPHGHPISPSNLGRQITPIPSHSPNHVPPPHSYPVNHVTTTTTTSIAPSANPSVTSTTNTTSRSTTSTTNGTMVAVVSPDVCHSAPQQQYTPPPLSGPMSQPQGPPPPYCPQEYIPGDPYYPGPPPEYCQHSMCTLPHHGVPGPATVRMVSTNSSPPIPLPVQMPPGHVVQQIVDETGTLQHVILSAQPLPLPVCSYGPNASQGHPQFYSPPPPGPPTPQGYMTSYQPGPQYPPVMSPPLTQPSPPPHNYQKNDRNTRQHEKMRNKFYQRHQQQPVLHHHHYQQPPQHPQHYQPLHLKSQPNATIHHTPPLSPKKDTPLLRKTDEENMDGEMCETPQVSLHELLSRIKPPEVSRIGPHNAYVHWAPPDLTSLYPKGSTSPGVRYEVFLNNSIYDSVSTTQITLTNLRPGTEYKLHLVSLCNGVKGFPTPKQTFVTKATCPDAPLPPRLIDKKKNSIAVKWNAPKDNGARILHYNLEIFGGQFTTWTEVYQNKTKEFFINKLKPQTTYKFRVSASNEVGDSEFSQETSVTTSGYAPSQPNPPTLGEATVNSLRLSWARRSCDESFSLEMEDDLNDYGFQPVFSGSETSFTCTNLRRNADYKFRLCTHNMNGKSQFSEVACFRTLPDLPQPPSAPSLKGKAQSDRLTVSWTPPVDHGGAPVSLYHLQIEKENGFESVYSGANLECEISGLSPGKTYQVRCAAESAGGRSKWSAEGQVTTKPVVPGHCKSPRLVGKPKANTLLLKWGYPDFDGGSPVTEYHLEMMTPDTDKKQIYCGRDQEFNVTGLLPGRAYIFSLRAANKVGAGAWSDPYEVVSGAGPPDPPRMPHLACRGSHVVQVSWEEPINNGASIDQYIVQMAEVSCPSTESSESSSTCGEPDAELTFSQVYAGSSPHTEVRNLTPATTYAFRVCASNVAGFGPYSSSSSVTTPAAPPAPVAHVTSFPESNEVTLHWTEPACHGDPITHYKIEMGDRITTTPGPVLEYTLRDLSPETLYKFRIQAVNSVGSSPFSSVHKVTTQPLPPSPPRIDLVKASYNSLRLKWGDGRNPDLLKYSLQMEYLNPRNNTVEFYQVYSGTSQSFKICKLDENTSYKLRINAMNEAGIGPNSDPVEFTTTKAPPPPLKAPRVSQGLNGTYCVEWCGARCPGEDRIVYRLQMLQAGKDQDYSLIYTGSETSYILTNLSPQSGYYVRVCGVRMSGVKEVVAGAYSSPTLYNTPKAEEEEETSDGTSRGIQEQSLQWRHMTDHQKAVAILVAFSFFAFIAAYVLSPSPDIGR